MKKKITLALFCIISVLAMAGCDNNSSSYNPYNQNDAYVPAYTPTKKIVLTQPSRELTQSEAESLAKNHIKNKYKEYSPVVIGRAEHKYSYDTTTDYGFLVTGHYWVSDKYGNNSSKRNFTEGVYVNKRTGECKRA